MEAVLRVRCSEGLEVENYLGSCYLRTQTDVDLPAIDCDKSIMVKIKHDDKLQEGAEAVFQSALLYTSTSGASTQSATGLKFEKQSRFAF